MVGEKYMCRICRQEFVAIPDAEEPPECPECESDEVDRLERATYGGTTEELDFTPRNRRPV